MCGVGDFVQRPLVMKIRLLCFALLCDCMIEHDTRTTEAHLTLPLLLLQGVEVLLYLVNVSHAVDSVLYHQRIV